MVKRPSKGQSQPTSKQSLQDSMVIYLKSRNLNEIALKYANATPIPFRDLRGHTSLPEDQEASEAILRRHHIQFQMNLHKNYFIHFKLNETHNHEVGIFVTRNDRMILYQFSERAGQIKANLHPVILTSESISENEIMIDYPFEGDAATKIPRSHHNTLFSKALTLAVHAVHAINEHLLAHPEDFQTEGRTYETSLARTYQTDTPAFIDTLSINHLLSPDVQQYIQDCQVYDIDKLVDQSRETILSAKDFDIGTTTDIQQWTKFTLPHKIVSIESSGPFGQSTWLLAQLSLSEFGDPEGKNTQTTLEPNQKIANVIWGQYFTQRQQPQHLHTAMLLAYLDSEDNLIKLVSTQSKLNYSLFQIVMNPRTPNARNNTSHTDAYVRAWCALRFLGLYNQNQLRLSSAQLDENLAKEYKKPVHEIHLAELLNP